MQKTPQEYPENKKYDMESFRLEIAGIVDDEKRGKRGGSGHFLKPGGKAEANPDFRPEELVEEDMLIWEKVKNKSISRADFEGYKKSVADSEGAGFMGYPPKTTRSIFLGFLGNIATPIILKREIGGEKK